ncbi:MAG TPA: DUF3006 domain-containing protein [Bacillota bacterium]|nr:DUF3006 domain-containing protein [Bacillota bacterium]
MKVTIDRFENSYAVVELENHNLAVIPRQIIDPEAQVGDVLEIHVDRHATETTSNSLFDFLDNNMQRLR